MPREFSPHAAKNPRSSGTSPSSGPLSGVKLSGPQKNWRMPASCSAGKRSIAVGEEPGQCDPSPAAARRTRGPPGSDRATRAPPSARTARRACRRPPRGSSRSGPGPRRPARRGRPTRPRRSAGSSARRPAAAAMTPASSPSWRPHMPAAIDHGLGLDRALVRHDAGDAAVGRREAGDRYALDDRARRPCGRPSRSLRDVGRVGATLVGHPGGRDDVVDPGGGPVTLNLFGADHLDRHAVGLGEGRPRGSPSRPAGACTPDAGARCVRNPVSWPVSSVSLGSRSVV